MSTGFNPLAGKLRQFAVLSDADEAQLDQMLGASSFMAPGEIADFDVQPSEEAPLAVPVVLEGVIARVRRLDGGCQQITGILVPGDMCDVHCTFLNREKYAIRALSSCKLAMLPVDAVSGLVAGGGQLTLALWRSGQIDAAIAREWIAGLGRRDALGRMAHFLCEMQRRLQRAGLADAQRFEMPITQRLLADTLGLSVVHVNRTIKKMQRDGLIKIRRSMVEVLDPEQLQAAGNFDAGYLNWSVTG